MFPPVQGSLFPGGAGADPPLSEPPRRVAAAPPEPWHRGLTHRLRVLLHMAPLHELRQSDARRDPELRHYDALALAMKVMDLIVDSAGLDKEVDRDVVEQALGPLLAAMDEAAGVIPERPRHSAMVDRVLAGLRNDGERRRPFEVTYTDLDADGRAVRRRLEFRLVMDHLHPAGGTVLRLSNEALNLYLNALDLDIEDAQAAAEAVVESQLARGRLDDAAQAARNARWQSLRYGEKVVTILRDTRRDVDSVDWRAEIPRLLADALGHIELRLAVERNILSTAEERLTLMAPGEPGARALVEVSTLISDCRLRHLDLHDRLMRSRNIFLDEQARQTFAWSVPAAWPNLLGEALEPAMRADQRLATEHLDALFPDFFGARAPAVASLAELVGWCLRPRRDVVRTDVAVTAPELTTPAPESLDGVHFDAAAVRAVERALATVSRPTPLSELLELVSGAGARAPLELMTLVALQHYAPEDDAQLPLVVRRAPGRQLAAHGFSGDDLEIAPRSRRAVAAEPPADAPNATGDSA
ncbi:MAG: hypothetical protein CVU56_23700 [Deltaproteobacteria bacterium HGW-Deltaproteobacteria-14]|nr:MAG: hypothetical protein CVU56_23700 [Deltaproteobacteria bacterium HGW-Deltaproteobacteria-14]